MKQTELVAAILKNKKYLAAGFLVMVLAVTSILGDRTTTSPKQPEPTVVSSSLWQNNNGENNLPTVGNTGPSQDASDMGTYQEEPLWSLLLGLITKLGLVLALIYISVLGLRQFIFRRKSILKPRGSLNVIESQPLGATVALHLVQVGDKLLLIGAGNNEVRVLSEIGKIDTQRPEEEQNAADNPVDTFAAKLEALTGTIMGNKTVKGTQHEMDVLTKSDLTDDQDINAVEELEEILGNCSNYLQRKIMDVRRITESWDERSELPELPTGKKAVAAAISRRG